jgi:hypothetical protein
VEIDWEAAIGALDVGLVLREGVVGKREKRLVAVQARLQRITASHDLSRVLESAAIAEARQLGGIATDDDLPARHLPGWLHWYRFQALPGGQDGEDLQSAQLLSAGSSRGSGSEGHASWLGLETMMTSLMLSIPRSAIAVVSCSWTEADSS